MSGWDFRVPSWSEIEQRLSHWGDALHTGIAGGLDRMGAAAQLPLRRVHCLRMAMWEGQSIARGNLLHRFADLDIQQILPGLLDVAKDMVLVLAGSMATGGLIGGVVGGAAGVLGGGVSAIPAALAGAAGGAAIGLEVGNWILMLLGLGAIGEYVLTSLPRLIDKYQRGIAIAWSGLQGPTGPYPDMHTFDRERDAIHAAAREFAAADEALVVLLLAGIAAYLLHRGGKAVNVLSREVRSGKLGEKFGDWLTLNAEKLKAREDLGVPQRGGMARGNEGPKLGRTQAKGGDEQILRAEQTDVISAPSALQQATNLFSSNTPGTLQIGGSTFAELPNAGNAAIFSGATDAQVQQYFMELTSISQMPSPVTIPGKGTLYIANSPTGNFTLRDFSSSLAQTGPAWTIDIPKAAVGTTYNPEIKFLKGGGQ